MKTVKTDLNWLTRDGLLKVYVSLCDDALSIGEQVTVTDVFSGEEDKYVAIVKSIGDHIYLLEVDWTYAQI